FLLCVPVCFCCAPPPRAPLQAAARASLPPPMPFWLLLIFTYGMFIPNNWRRAGLVIGAMALAPVLLFVGMLLAYPQVSELVTVVGVMQYVLVLLVAAAAAVFGTHLINTLRPPLFQPIPLRHYPLIKPLST